MPGLVATQEGCIELWQTILQGGSVAPPNCHLIGQGVVLDHTKTEAFFAANELSVGGYSPISLISGNWTITAIAAGSQAAYVTISWTFTGPCTVYGYWLSDAANAKSLWAELFSSPFVYGAGGGPFSLILPPTLTSAP